MEYSCRLQPGSEASVSTPKRRVVILGGGFGGIYTALALERTLRTNEEFEVTLVSRDNYFLFTPMLPEVAASDLIRTQYNRQSLAQAAETSQHVCGHD
jgi:NADH dehydrogenase FAD-containing subunit